jgi:histone deacetylase complex regulatory component SIN3
MNNWLPPGIAISGSSSDLQTMVLAVTTPVHLSRPPLIRKLHFLIT